MSDKVNKQMKEIRKTFNEQVENIIKFSLYERGIDYNELKEVKEHYVVELYPSQEWMEYHYIKGILFMRVNRNDFVIETIKDNKLRVEVI